MGDSAVIGQRESVEDELLVEHFEIVDSEQPGGSESEGESAGGTESGEGGEGGEGEQVIWEGGPDKK